MIKRIALLAWEPQASPSLGPAATPGPVDLLTETALSTEEAEYPNIPRFKEAETCFSPGREDILACLEYHSSRKVYDSAEITQPAVNSTIRSWRYHSDIW